MPEQGDGRSGQPHPPAPWRQIHDQLTSAATLPDGPVRMQLSFTVGPRRNWLNEVLITIEADSQQM